ERIFALTEEGYTHDAVAKMYNLEGVPTTRGGRWWGSTIAHIIRNLRYKGEFPIGRMQTVRAQRAYQPRPSRLSTGREGKGRPRVRTSHRIKHAGEWLETVVQPEC